jgi:2-oxo-4-hydroxy-4-carboxy--5-ureidoimidazoline (OHCU) decarboxylase
VVEWRFRQALAGRKPKADLKKRAAELHQQIEHLADAIAKGLLRSSPALARKLAAAEAELAKVQASQ